MKVPETYEEFLKLTNDEIEQLCDSMMSLNDAKKLMKYFDKFDNECPNKIILEDKLNQTFGDYLK